MNKSMYSLMLMDSIVKEIDRRAYLQNTNRSNLINQILAEYLSIATPEKKIKEVFDYIVNDIQKINSFKIQALPSDFVLSIKSPLEYKYKPTIKYSVELYRTMEKQVGELRVVFRTQSPELLTRLENFFKIWVKLESYYLGNIVPISNIKYSLEEGKFRRTLLLPKEADIINNKIISRAISDYIKMFDNILKIYLYDANSSEKTIETEYIKYLNSGMTIV